MSSAYGIWSAVAAVSVIGAIVWHDPFNAVALLGIALVIVGVVLLESSTGKEPSRKDESDAEPMSS